MLFGDGKPMKFGRTGVRGISEKASFNIFFGRAKFEIVIFSRATLRESSLVRSSRWALRTSFQCVKFTEFSFHAATFGNFTRISTIIDVEHDADVPGAAFRASKTQLLSKLKRCASNLKRLNDTNSCFASQ